MQLAKISTLGERAEDTFLLQGAELQSNQQQIRIETELLQAFWPINSYAIYSCLHLPDKR